MFRTPALSSTEKAKPPPRPLYIPAPLPDSFRSALRMDIHLTPQRKKHESLRIEPPSQETPPTLLFEILWGGVTEPLGATSSGECGTTFFLSARKDIAPLTA